MSTAVERRWFDAVASLETCVLCGRYGVQVAHQNEGRGMGQKSKPWQTAALCPECHQEIDNGRDMSQLERRDTMRTARLRTIDKLIETGRLVLK